MNLDPELNKVLIDTSAQIIAKNVKPFQNWIKRQYIKLAPVDFNILLSLNSEEGINTGTYYKEIKKNLTALLDQTGLSNTIKIKDVSGLQKFENKENAGQFRRDTNIDLIIWGDFTNDTLKKDGKNLSELKLNFTYGHPDDPQKKIGSMIQLDLGSKFAIKNYWKIFEQNSFDDIKIVSNNLFHMAVYILALTLKIWGRILKSVSLYEKLYDELEKKGDNFKDFLKPHLLNCYELLICDALWNKKKYELGRDFSNKFLVVAPDHHWGLTNLAYFHYKLGAVDDAKKIVAKMLALYPKKAATILNSAFFYILQKRYTKAYECYRKLLKTKEAYLQFDSQILLEFLGNEYEATQDPALLYASGIIALNCSGDEVLAKEDLNNFLKIADPVKYKFMVNHAKRILVI